MGKGKKIIGVVSVCLCVSTTDRMAVHWIPSRDEVRAVSSLSSSRISEERDTSQVNCPSFNP